MLATLNPDWSDQYVQYNVLKKQIKEVSQAVQREHGTQPRRSFAVAHAAWPGDSTRHESDYAEGRQLLKRLTDEVQKVDAFYRSQERQLSTTLELLLASDTKSSDLRTRVAKYFTELVALRDFAQLNYTAVNKILKKHDKYLPFKIRQEFMREHIAPLPVFGPLDSLCNLMSRTQVRVPFAARPCHSTRMLVLRCSMLICLRKVIGSWPPIASRRLFATVREHSAPLF